MQPALTPEESSGEDNVILETESPKLGHFVQLDRHADGVEVFVAGPSSFILDAEELHRFAAYALHGQPFGFTREDVRVLLLAIAWAQDDQAGLSPAEERTANSLAARIEALLPPEPK
jgi:hypothetical protein